MALTLSEANKYSTTELDRKVIDRLVKDSPILERLKFIEILGNSLTYDTIITDAGAQFYNVGDTWVESTLVLEQDTAVLRILGGDADVDNFLLKTRANKIDLKGTVLENKIKAIQYKFLDTFYYGDNSTNAKEFNGLQKLLTSTTYNTVHAGSGTGDVLSIAKLQEAIDLIRNRQPALMVMTRKMRRGINVWLDSIGDHFISQRDGYGVMIDHFRGIPIVVDDHIVDIENTVSGAYDDNSTGAETTIFILAFDEDAVCGIHSGDRVKTVPIGDLETKDASRWRIKWYCSMMFQDLRSSAKVDGITASGTVAA